VKQQYPKVIIISSNPHKYMTIKSLCNYFESYYFLVKSTTKVIIFSSECFKKRFFCEK